MMTRELKCRQSAKQCGLEFRTHLENPYISQPLDFRLETQPAVNQRDKMIRNLFFGVSLACLAWGQAYGQQDPQLTQWYNDHAAYNIGASGFGNLTTASAFKRSQWTGLNKSVETTLVNVNGQLGFIPGAVGVQFYDDQIGNEKNTMIKLGYAYQLPVLSNGVQIGIGLSASMFSKSFETNWFAVDGLDQPWNVDPVIPSPNNAAGNSVDADFGIFMKKGNDYYAGLSVTHLAQQELSSLNITSTRHFYFTGGYNYPISGNDLVLRSNIMAKSDLNATALDVNVNVLANDVVMANLGAWAGGTFRAGDAIAPAAGVSYSMSSKGAYQSSEQLFKLGYSYDMTTSALNTFVAGTHEVFLSYAFKFTSTPPETKYANPRFL